MQLAQKLAARTVKPPDSRVQARKPFAREASSSNDHAIALVEDRLTQA
jgi:hypothetical protein